MNVLFLMDPLENVVFEKDTSLALMWGAQNRGHRIFYLPNNILSMTESGVRFHVREIEATKNKQNLFILKEEFTFFDKDIDIIFIRTDPPFDPQYLINTWILDQLPKRIAVINKPSGIRTVNEKLWAMQFKDLVPPSLASQNKDELFDFLKQHQTVIAKPTNSYGGQKIFKIYDDDVNRNVTLETLTENFSQKIILQEYVEAAKNGDKRILLLNGDPLGAVLRVHAEGEHRNNFFAGGKPIHADITKRDHEIIQKLKPELRNLGLYFVGIDILGDYLIEVNVTSPTCLQEINRLHDITLEEDVLTFAEILSCKLAN